MPGQRGKSLEVTYTNLLTGKQTISIPVKDCEVERKDESTLILNRTYHVNFSKSASNYISHRDYIQLNLDFQEAVAGALGQTDSEIPKE